MPKQRMQWELVYESSYDDHEIFIVIIGPTSLGN